MTLDAAQHITEDSENNSDVKYVAGDNNAYDPVAMAAMGLIQRYRAGKISTQMDKPGLLAKAFGNPAEARRKVTNTLKTLGHQHDIDALCLQALEQYVDEHGEVPNASKVIVTAQIADTLPDAEFDSGHRVVIAVDENGADFIGASDMGLAIAPGGSITTSRKGEADERLGGIIKTKLFVMINFPERSELDALEAQQEAAFAAIAEVMSEPAAAADKLDAVIAQIEQLGGISDIDVAQTVELVQNVIELNTLTEAGITPDNQASAQALTQSITEQVAGLSDSLPPAIADAAQQTIASATIADIAVSMTAPDAVARLDGLTTQIQQLNIPAAQKTEAIQLITNAVELKTLSETGTTPQTQERVQVLNETIAAQLTTQAEHLPPAIAAAAQQSVAQVAASAPDIHAAPAMEAPPTSAQTIPPAAATELAVVIQTLSTADNLPPAIQNIIETLTSGAPITPEAIMQAAQTKSDATPVATPERHEAGQAPLNKTETTPASADTHTVPESNTPPQQIAKLQDLIVTLAQPDVQAALPAQTREAIAPAIETIAAATAIRDIHHAIAHENLPPATVKEARAVVQALETGTSLRAIEPAKIDVILNKPDSPVVTFVKTTPVAAPPPAPVSPVVQNLTRPDTAAPIRQDNVRPIPPAAIAAQVQHIAAQLPPTHKNEPTSRVLETVAQAIKKDGVIPPALREQVQPIINKLPEGPARQDLQRIIDRPAPTAPPPVNPVDTVPPPRGPEPLPTGGPPITPNQPPQPIREPIKPAPVSPPKPEARTPDPLNAPPPRNPVSVTPPVNPVDTVPPSPREPEPLPTTGGPPIIPDQPPREPAPPPVAPVDTLPLQHKRETEHRPHTERPPERERIHEEPVRRGPISIPNSPTPPEIVFQSQCVPGCKGERGCCPSTDFNNGGKENVERAAKKTNVAFAEFKLDMVL